MKQWIILALAGVGVYSVWKWYTHRAPNVPTGQNAQPGITPNPLSFNLVYPSDGSTLVSGVPAFVAIPVEAGHGDQLVASRHTNDMATMSGPYQIPFGVNANQGSGASIW